MNVIHYIGLDVHKKTVSYCIKTAAGQIVKEGTVGAERSVLRSWARSLPQPWHGAMEATIFSAWIYDTLKPYGGQFHMLHPMAGLLCVLARTAGSASADALSPHDGSAVCENAQQDSWPADGKRSFLSEDKAAGQEVLRRSN